MVFHTHDDFFEFLVMSFRLCSALATFQALMNNVLLPFLRWFVLVFFDDILIYNKSWVDHLCHLGAIFTILRQHKLFVKGAKCAFDIASISYLGHVISQEGIAMGLSMVQVISNWLVPRSARVVRGFLGLAGYYRKFIHNFGSVAASLTDSSRS
jgi:hypothetical protein